MSASGAGAWAVVVGLVALALGVAPGATRVRGRLQVAARRPADDGGAVRDESEAGPPARRGSRALSRRARTPEPGLLDLAGCWDLFAACLRAGMPVPTALRVIAGDLTGAAGTALAATADLLVLGAAPDQAWRPALDCPATTAVAKAARRSGHSGAGLAEALTAVAAGLREAAATQAEERAQRAGVLVAGPLGLCFLPAFLVLGVLPVVLGLASGLLAQWPGG